jgi:hypothetical protein
MQVPLFPLNTVLFPGGPLPLRIFEPRYLDMISACMKQDAPFGVLLIRRGGETGHATTWNIGTLARVTDWYQGSDGILGITAVGTERFRLLSTERRADGLNVAALPPILETVLDDLGRLYEDLERRPDDARWVMWRFAEILPIGLEEKQSFLESDETLSCLQTIERVLHSG